MPPLARLLLVVAAGGSLAGCSDPSPALAQDAGVVDAGADALTPPDLPRTRGEDELAPMRAACAFGAGAWPAETLGKELPIGADIPIDHVIVIMQENRSFDNYLGRLVADGYYQEGEVDVPPAGWSNLDASGATVVPHKDDAFCYGVNHSWADMHDQWNEGRNDRFVLNNEPDGQRAFYYEDDTIIPFYYALADTFAIGDRYFASVLTSTWPNRYFVMGATSYGIGDNSFNPLDTRAHPVLHIFSELDAGRHTWKDYADGPHMLSFYPFFGFQNATQLREGDVRCDLMNDIANDQLPDVAFVMGGEVGGVTSDEGPSALPGIGGAMVEQIIRALWASPAWPRTAVFITYDENGGMADHALPVAACEPDALAPHDGDGHPLPGKFDITGQRVPFIVVSPYARPHFVSHQVYDHTSITRFIEACFGLPAMTARDANAAVPLEMFDFAHPAFMTPPTIAAHTTVDPAVLTRCGQEVVTFGCPP